MAEDTTCWTMIEGAARGVREDLDRFIHLYGPVIRAYLRARWREGALREEVEDASQEVFLECFRQQGVLAGIAPAAIGSFRAFLLGVVRNVARRAEKRRARKREVQPPTTFEVDHLMADEQSLSRVFDRAWASALLVEAVDRQTERARLRNDDRAENRVELLRLRFQEGLTLPEIAERWGVSPGVVKGQNARALEEFEAALREVIAFHEPGAHDAGADELERLLALLE